MADPDVDAIVADLTQTGVHRGPGTQGWVSDDELAAITATVQEAGLPVHLVLVVPDEDGDIYQGDDLLVRVHDAGGPDGLYVGVNNVWRRTSRDGPPTDPFVDGGAELNLALQQWGDVAASGDLTRDVETVLESGNSDADGPGAPYPLGEGLQQVVQGLADGSFPAMVDAAREGADARYEKRVQEREEGGGNTGIPILGGDDADGSVGAGDVVAVVLVVAVVAAAVTALVRRARRARRGRPGGRKTFVLPDSVLDRVREAGDAELARRARKDVLDLGERIDAAEMTGSDSAAWSAALDHYEAAGRVLPADDATVDPLDAVGAVVLAARGVEALEAARRGRRFTPTTPCFLNPLHGRAVRDRELEHRGRRLRAPICAACRADLQAERRPDILDVVVAGKPRHYFETDREPWASTGFGALEPDLVTRLHQRPRRG